MSPSIKIDKNEYGISNEKTYGGMIGSLIYLTGNEQDTMISVCLCARY